MPYRNDFVRAIATALLCSAVSLVALAQVSGGKISGTVADQTGAVLAGVEVEITNTATGVSRTLVTNASGAYSAPNLNVGNYEVIVRAKGFRPAKETAILGVGAEVTADIHLQMGTETAEVSVQGVAPTIDLTSSAVNAAVEGAQLRELPLNGRDWTMLGALEPGVHTMDTQTDPGSNQTNRSNRGWGAQMSIAGSRPQQTNYRMDGVTMNDYAGGGSGGVSGMSLGVDAIQEFSVFTSNAGPEYGRTSGGVLNAVSRAGTNQFHGSAYEFLRNSALDAKNYFDKAGVPPPFKRNQFGIAAGGPIVENRTFIFGDYEGLRQNLSLTNVINVPSANAHNGDVCVKVGTNSCANLTHVTIDPQVAKFLALFPLPNVPSTASSDTGQYSFVGGTVTNENMFTTRVDHKFSEKDSMHGTFMLDNSGLTMPDAYGLALKMSMANHRLVSIEESHFFSNAVANFIRVGFSRVVASTPVQVKVLDSRLDDPAYGFIPGYAFGQISVSTTTLMTGGVAGQAPITFNYNSYQLYDDLVWIRGNHSFKFGGSLERIQNREFGTAASGNWGFKSVQDFLANKPSNFTSQIPGGAAPLRLRQTVVGGYASDDWRVLRNLSLNLGVRYEMATVPTEVNNNLATLTSPTAVSPRVGSPFFNNPTLRNFAPRVGFSWDPFKNGKTAVRGGFGVYDTLPLIYQFNMLLMSSAPVFDTRKTTDTVAMKGQFPTGGFPLLTSAKNLNKVAYVEQDPSRSYVMQWNFNIQRELGQGFTLTTGYTGSHGVHQPFRSGDINIVLPIGKNANGQYIWPKSGGTKLNPNNGIVDAIEWNVSTVYDALIVHLTRQTKGLRTGVSYTWGKSLDTGSSSNGGANFQNSISDEWFFDPKLFRSLSDFNIAHVLVANAMWDVPGPHSEGIVNKLAGGWQLGGIFRVSTGQPFTPSIGGDPLGIQNDVPFGWLNRVDQPGCSNPVNPGKVGYVTRSCFAAPFDLSKGDYPTLGNAGRNSLVGPGIVNLDVSAYKNNRIARFGEHFNIQFRAELFNVLNHTNFSTPTQSAGQLYNFTSGAIVENSTGGALVKTSTTSRQIQFALKVIW
ncbi:MAG: carboxypeptidase regulatory-like domain-containing protein [Terriglobales bacterium]|jgi:hypothetical protein